MTFWGADLTADLNDPKRKFRWKVQITTPTGGLGESLVWYAKTVTKPAIEVNGDTEHKFLGHTFKFPGSVTWNDIEMTLVDPGNDSMKADAARELLGIIEGSGYKFPTSENMLETISKGKAKAALGSFVISQLNNLGETIEQWTLHNPFVTSVNFNDLSYDDDSLSEINLTVKYDWAEFKSSAADDGTSDFFEP